MKGKMDSNVVAEMYAHSGMSWIGLGIDPSLAHKVESRSTLRRSVSTFVAASP